MDPIRSQVSSGFANRDANVLIVESLGPFRDALRRTVNGFGFANVQAVSGIKDAIGYLETEPQVGCVWIVAGMFGDADLNILHLLALVLRHTQLRSVRISVFYRPEDAHFLPTAFELGLMSCHQIQNKTVASAELELKSLQTLLTRCGHDTVVACSHYLRGLLKSNNEAPMLLDFEKELLQIYPRSAYQILNVAEAYFLNNRNDDGRASLAQARFANPAVIERADQIFEKHLGRTGSSADRYKFADVFKLDSCTIVDPDATVHTAVAGALQTIGINDIRYATNATDAYAAIRQNGAPGLLVMEWKMPGLSGAALLQRIRDLGLHDMPVFVLSGKLIPSQRNLLRELGVAGIAEKPFGRDEFLRTMVTALRASWFPTHYKTVMRNILKYIAAGRLEEARNLKDKMLAAKDSIPPEVRKSLEARFAYADDDFDKAHRIATELVQLDPDNLQYQDLLGKVLLKLGEYEAAVMCFNRAQDQAPENLERQCGIADALVELGEYERADETIDLARKVDAASVHVLNSDAKLGLVTGNLERTQKAMALLESNTAVLAYLNNRAVAFARSGRHTQSINLYGDALKAIPLSQPHLRAIVTYNLALANIRCGNVADAESRLAEADGMAQGRFRERTARLLARVRAARAAGTTITIETKDSEIRSLTSPDGDEALGDAPAKPGEVCCFTLFKRVDTGEITQVFDALPTFKRRASISRGKTTKRTSGGYE